MQLSPHIFNMQKVLHVAKNLHQRGFEKLRVIPLGNDKESKD